jgi:hypothetical protein
LCVHVWRYEGKRGRDYGTCHQDCVQAIAHDR